MLVNEDVVKDTLSKWLNQFNIKVYWEKENPYNYPVFKSSLRERPDLIIENNNKYFAIEVKDASHDSNVYNSFLQIVKYASNEARYFIGFREIKINGYLIATQFSINGHLYREETIAIPGQGRQWAITHGETPKREYVRTKDLVRNIWRESNEKNIKYGVGVLLSNILNNDFGISPLIQFKVGRYQQYEVW